MEVEETGNVAGEEEKEEEKEKKKKATYRKTPHEVQDCIPIGMWP